MMRRLFKPLMLVAGAMALLLVLLVLVAPLLVSGEGMREMMIERASEATGADVSLGEASLRVLPRLVLRLGDGRVTGTGQALAARQGGDFNLVDFDVVVDRIDLRVALWPLLGQRIEVESFEVVVDRLTVTTRDDRIIAEQAVLTVGELSLGLPESPPVAAPGRVLPPGELIPEDIGLSADLHVAKLTAQQALYEDVVVTAELDGRLLDADTITARRMGGTISGTAEIDWERDPWGELVFSFATEGVPAGALLEPWAPDIARRLETDLVGEGSGRCSIRDAATAQATLDLTGRVGAGDGVLHAADWLREAIPYLGERRDLVDVRFRSLEHAFRIEKGRYLVQELAIDGLDTQWYGDGWVGLDGKAMDLNLHVRLPAGFTPDLGNWSFLANTLRDDQGRVRLDLRLTGPTRHPGVALDLSQLMAK